MTKADCKKLRAQVVEELMRLQYTKVFANKIAARIIIGMLQGEK